MRAMIARQRIHIGIHHYGRTVDVEEADSTWRVYDGDLLLAEVSRNHHQGHRPVQGPQTGLSLPSCRSNMAI
jgi:hypothetical protein